MCEVLESLVTKQIQSMYTFKDPCHKSDNNNNNNNNTTLKKLHWLPIKQRIGYKTCLLTYKTLTNQQPTYLNKSLSFPSHSVYTRSSDSLVLSIPYVRSSLGKRAFSVIGPRLWNSLPLIPETHLLYQYSVPDSKHTSSKLRSLPRLFPISLDCLPGF